MKILQLLDERWDSGITAYALHISALLKKAGHHVVVGVRRGKKPEFLAQQKNLETVVVENFFYVRKILSNEAWDIINVHTGKTHTWAVLAKLLSGHSKTFPALVRTRGDARPVQVNWGSKFIYQQTQGIITASQHIESQYQSFRFPKKFPLKTVYPAVEVDSVATIAEPFTVGILGRLDPVKGHSVFLEAAAEVCAEIPQAQFFIAGKEANISMTLLQNQIDQLGITKHVSYLGFQSSAIDFMRRCSVGVVASVGSEEVSRACLEWMAVGRPVVGTLVGCLPELIETDETGYLVPPGDFKAMAHAIIGLLKNPQLRTQFGARSQSLISSHYSDSVMLQKTLDVYQWAQNQKETM